MKSFVRALILILLTSLHGEAQTALDFFTNQANSLLQSNYGFGITNIPIYSPTDTNVAYTPAIHYLLQSAANLYDATTPETNPPSVFRPQFGQSNGVLYIVGYTNVGTNFSQQIALRFYSVNKTPNYPDINVWGIPWVVGMKRGIPAFDDYVYQTAVTANRTLLFQRRTINFAPDTNHPPQYTNQFCSFSISNAFGLRSRNYSTNTLSNTYSLYITNFIVVGMTNNYDYGFYWEYVFTNQWSSFLWPQISQGAIEWTNTNIVPLPPAYYSEATKQFIFESGASNQYRSIDLNQKGWPAHNWSIQITNYFIYALIDSSSGCVLDFVNLGNIGEEISVTDILSNSPPLAGLGMVPIPMWVNTGANDTPQSPMSVGLTNQILVSESTNVNFYYDLNGVPPGGLSDPGFIFGAPFTPTATFVQTKWLHAANPMAHYTLGDLMESDYTTYYPPNYPHGWLTNLYSMPTCPFFLLQGGSLATQVNDATFQLSFNGSPDLPFIIWKSSDLLNWIPFATPTQPAPGSYFFSDDFDTNGPSFYQVRVP